MMNKTILFLALLILGCTQRPELDDEETFGSVASAIQYYEPEPEFILFEQTNFTSEKGEDLGGKMNGSHFEVTWPKGEAPIEPIIAGMIARMEHLQTTPSGSMTNQKKLFELVDLERRLKTIEDE